MRASATPACGSSPCGMCRTPPAPRWPPWTPWCVVVVGRGVHRGRGWRRKDSGGRRGLDGAAPALASLSTSPTAPRLISPHLTHAPAHNDACRATRTSCTSSCWTSAWAATARRWASICTPPGSSQTPGALVWGGGGLVWGWGGGPTGPCAMLRCAVCCWNSPRRPWRSAPAPAPADQPLLTSPVPPAALHALHPTPRRSRADRLNAFLEYALTQPNVFLVTVSQVLDWMKNPGGCQLSWGGGPLSVEGEHGGPWVAGGRRARMLARLPHAPHPLR